MGVGHEGEWDIEGGGTSRAVGHQWGWDINGGGTLFF